MYQKVCIYICSNVKCKSPGAPQAFCPDTDPFVDGLFPWSEVFIQHLETLDVKQRIKKQNYLVIPRVVGPELALAVLKAECSTAGHVSDFDALCGVQLVNIIIFIVIIITFVVYKLCPEYFVSSSSEQSEQFK